MAFVSFRQVLFIKWSASTVRRGSIVEVVDGSNHSLLLLHRGEALNPGPGNPGQGSWSMGTFNPSGLGGKHQVIASYLNNCHLWAITETHMTSQGMRAFRQGLKWSESQFNYCIGGHPFPLRSHSSATGHWNGVAVLSKSPTRAVPVQWSAHTYETSRVQLTATLCEDKWITGGVLYGEPPGTSHPDARENTDTLALEVVSHLCQMSGLRFFAGDLNFESGLEVFQVLEAAGFKDIQDAAFEMWGTPIKKTCKQKTRKDFFYISRELLPFLTGVVVDDTVWADHAVLQGFFSCAPSQLARYHWRQPTPIEWPQSFDIQFSADFHQETDPTRKYQLMWQDIEFAGNRAKITQGQPPLAKRQCGRGMTLETKLLKQSFHRGPVKAGRNSDVQPSFAGMSQQHAHWFRQLRRLQSFVRFRAVHDVDTPTGHGASLWSSVLRAKGFDGNFGQWWKAKSSRVFGAPESIPLIPPNWEVSKKIYESFLLDVRTFEQSLKSQRCKHARDKRKELAHLIFRDIRRPAPDRVDVLLKSPAGEIVQVDRSSNTFIVSPECKLSVDHPVFIAGTEFQILRSQDTKVWLHDVSTLQPGQAVRQTIYKGVVTDMFRAFAEEWTKRWDRHKNVPQSQWQQICDFWPASFPV